MSSLEALSGALLFIIALYQITTEKSSTHHLKTHLIPIHKGGGVTSVLKLNVNLIKRELGSRLGHENKFASTFSVLSPNRGSVAGKQWLASQPVDVQ